MTTYLSRQKKGDLQELAKAADINNYSDLLKDELVSAIDEQLKANPSQYSSKPIFAEFYKRGGSPVKKERVASASVPAADGEAKTARRRRQTLKVKDELDSGTDETPKQTSTALATRTPKAVQRLAERVPLPPSPADVQRYITRGQTQITNKFSSLYKKSGSNEIIESAREFSSTVVGIQILSFLLEAVGLRRETLPLREAFVIPALPVLNNDSFIVKLPDFFVLVTSGFWAPSTLWVSTSLFLPLLFAYFFNFSHSVKGAGARTRSTGNIYTFDPLAYNISKALVTWLVFSQGFNFYGLWSPDTIAAVDNSLYGGYQGVLISTAIGAIASIYEAILSKH